MRGDLSKIDCIKELEDAKIILSPYGFNFSIKDVYGNSRVSELNDDRAILVYYFRVFKKYNFTKVGIILNRDHSTAIHLLNNYTNRKTSADFERYNIMCSHIDDLVALKGIGGIEAQIEYHVNKISELVKLKHKILKENGK